MAAYKTYSLSETHREKEQHVPTHRKSERKIICVLKRTLPHCKKVELPGVCVCVCETLVDGNQLDGLRCNPHVRKTLVSRQHSGVFLVCFTSVSRLTLHWQVFVRTRRGEMFQKPPVVMETSTRLKKALEASASQFLAPPIFFRKFPSIRLSCSLHTLVW